MFGRKKMYRKGMSDALRANEDFSRKQEEAIAFMREEVRQGHKSIEQALRDTIAKLDANIDSLYEHLSSREIAALYHLTTPYELKDLKKEYKQLLLAMLFQLANDELTDGSGVSASQQGYLRSVKRYLEIANPQTSLDDLTVIGEIDSLEIQKAFFQVALEFCYLQDSDEFTDSQFGFFECFAINSKMQDVIETQVCCELKAIGPEGLAEKYGYVPEDEPLYVGEEMSADVSDAELSVETAEGYVKGVHLDVDKKGYQTIQVDLEEPVFIGEVKYNHVPVLSVALFEELDLREGSKIKVFCTGDVVSAIELIDAGPGEKLHLPKCCRCGHKLITKAKKLYCNSPFCFVNQMDRLADYIKGIGVEGYDETALQKLMDDEDCPTIYTPSQLYTIPNEKFHKALVEATEACPDYKILGSMGIPDLGPARAKMLLKYIGSSVYALSRRSFRLRFFGMFAHNRYKDYCKDYPIPFMRLAHSMGRGIIADDIISACLATCTDATVARILANILTHPDTTCVMLNLAKYMKNFTTDFSDMIRVGHTGYTPSQAVIRICKENDFLLTDGDDFDILITNDYASKTDKMQKAINEDAPIFTEETFITRHGNEEEIKQRIYYTESVYDDGEVELDEDGNPVMEKHDKYYERECDDKYGFIPA